MNKLSAKDQWLLEQGKEPRRRRNRSEEAPWDKVYASAASGKAAQSGGSTYAQGSTVPVGEVVRVARSYRNDLEKTAAHLSMSTLAVQEALRAAGVRTGGS